MSTGRSNRDELGLSTDSGTFLAVLTLGIDIRTHVAVCALVSRSGKNVEFHSSWTVEFLDGQPSAETLRESVQQQCPQTPDRIACTFPVAKTSQRILELPFTDAKKLQATIPFELEAEVPLDIENSLVTWKLLDQTTQNSTVLAALASTQELQEHLSWLEDAGIDPEVLTLGLLATLRWVSHDCPEALLLDLHDDGGLAIVQEGKLRELHGIGASNEPALVEEAHWAIAAATILDGTPVLQVGDPASLQAIPIDTSFPRQSLREHLPSEFATIEEDAFCAVALAKAVAEDPRDLLNFRQGTFAYHAPNEEMRVQLRRTGWVAAVAGLMLVATWLLVFSERQSELTHLRAQILSQTATIVKKAPRGTEVRRVRAALDELEKKKTLMGGGTTGAPTLDRLFAIHEAIPAETPLEVVDLTIDARGVRFRGRTDTFESVDIVSRALESLPDFATASVQDVKAGVDGRIEFRATLETQEAP